MNARSAARLACILIALGSLGRPSAAQEPYPQIRALRPEDPIYAQLCESIERSRVEIQKGGAGASEELAFFLYKLPRSANVFEVAAAFSLPYETIATLNRLESPGPLSAGSPLLVPSAPGLFVPIEPKSDLEYLMASLRREGESSAAGVKARLGKAVVGFRFYPGAQFLASERAFFLVAGFRFPLPKGIITSAFGPRTDPFTGKPGAFHAGIDIAAPAGTPVLAAKAGRVEATAYDATYGNYVIISHGSGWETLYGHLSKIGVAAGARVSAGDAIGLVGSTGMSTGPHLHFETRRKGVAVNPEPLVGK
jgi:murein DD-endopeptidase MepM/ murein hydrolase activator NlpD